LLGTCWDKFPNDEAHCTNLEGRSCMNAVKYSWIKEKKTSLKALVVMEWCGGDEVLRKKIILGKETKRAKGES